MSVHVLDASAMVAYLGSETGGSIVRDVLLTPGAQCYAHAINLCEVYYDTIRKSDVEHARAAISTLFSDGIIQRRDMDIEFWQKVGEIKARGRISIADCFCIVLAEKISGEILTSDHHEFDALVPLGIPPIRFIR